MGRVVPVGLDDLNPERLKASKDLMLIMLLTFLGAKLSQGCCAQRNSWANRRFLVAES